MKSEWRVYDQKKADGTHVYYLYRLKNAEGPNVRGNWEFMKRNGFWAHCDHEEEAQRYANVFNELEKRTPPPATETPEAAKPN